jgi:hypothetical protein
MNTSREKPFPRRPRLSARMLEPLPASQWSFAMAAHLLNRAGFGAPPDAIEAATRLTPEAAVANLFAWDQPADTTPNPEWAKPDPERGEKLRALRNATSEERQRLQRDRFQVERRQMLELQHWWLERMARGPHPLREKLTLFWHGHFATSVLKVKDAYLMWRQNDLFRRLGGGDWRTLLDAVTRDPAMLLWLDQAQSKPAHPNENYARELLELFTLGEGHYTEQDVTESARALTGLTLDRLTQEPVFRPRLRDSGVKTVLGKSGEFGVPALLDLIAAQPQTDRFLTGRLWTFFAGVPPSPELQAELANLFRLQGQRFVPFLRTMLGAREFYTPDVVRQQIKSPVQLLVSACRQLERPLPPPRVCANTLRLLGQELFNPPNVKGWEGGIAWINTNTLLNRHNLALLLVTGENALPFAGRNRGKPGATAARQILNQPAGAADLEKLFPDSERQSAELLVAAVERRFLNASLRSRERQTLVDYMNSNSNTHDRDLPGLVRLAMCTPDYQLT